MSNIESSTDERVTGNGAGEDAHANTDLETTNLRFFKNLDWKKASQTKGKKGVLVEVAHVPGYELKAFRAFSTYDASVNQLRALIMDMDNITRWSHGTGKAKVISKIDEQTQACYCEHHVPWPVSNRDGVLIQRAVKLDENTTIINLESNNELMEEKKGFVRIEYLQGTWIMENVGAGKTKLTYQVHSDPKGNIPDWLVNSMITEAPTSTLAKIHKMDFSRY